MKKIIILLSITIFSSYTAFAASPQNPGNYEAGGNHRTTDDKSQPAATLKHTQTGKHAGVKTKKPHKASRQTYKELTNSQKALKEYQ